MAVTVVLNIDKLPLLQYLKEPALSLEEVYQRYPNGGEYGWFLWVNNERAMFYWDIEVDMWKILTPTNAKHFVENPELLEDGDSLIYDINTGGFKVFSLRKAASLSIRKTYSAKAEMEADLNPLDDSTLISLEYGQVVAVINDPVGANNGVYRYTNPGWELVFSYNESLMYIKENFSSLKIARIYDSLAIMQADLNPTNVNTGDPLLKGELVAISNPLNEGDPDNGKVYAWNTTGWSYMGTLNNLIAMEFTNNYFDTI